MHYKLLSVITFLVFGSVWAYSPGLDAARELSQEGVIVNYSAISGNSVLQEATLYKLSNTLIRQEAVGIALRLRNSTLPDAYTCNQYFDDTHEPWVCRAAEIAADNFIISRINTSFRPRDPLTVAEALGITMKALKIPLSSSDTGSVQSNIPHWQKRLILTLLEHDITMTLDTKILSESDLSRKITRGEFFQMVVTIMKYKNDQDPLAHCTTYTDGCNECSISEGQKVCTERACIWEGIPACYLCETGYRLENDRCIQDANSCVREGGYAGGGHVIGPEDPADFMCCSGLTRAERNDGTTFADAGYTCIREGDDICDLEYEGTNNSSDCRDEAVFNADICESYYDGCNSCTKTADGTSVCTLMACSFQGTPYCTSYIPYKPESEESDRIFLWKVLQEMKQYAQDISCTEDAQCKWSMTGTKACGGPTIAIPYSTKNVNELVVANKANYLTESEKLFDITYGIVSNCMFIETPEPMTCIDNVCQ